MPEPTQLPLFPDQATLTRIAADRNEWRFYRLAIWPDLFGRALLARHWGRIGTPGRIRLDVHPDAGRRSMRSGRSPDRSGNGDIGIAKSDHR